MNTRIQTPQMSKVRDLADSALNTPDGLEVIFRADKYGGLKGAHAAAKGVQTAFSSLRARTRRGAMRLNAEAEYSRDVKSIGPYDTLACVLSYLSEERGCKIALIPGSAYGMDFEVVDRATGEPFAPEDPNLNKFIFLGQKLITEQGAYRRERRPWVNPLSEDEMRWAWKYNPEDCVEFNYPKPKVMEIADAPTRILSDYTSVDLADLSEEELEFGEEGELANPSEGE